VYYSHESRPACMRCFGLFSIFLIVVSPKSTIMEIMYTASVEPCKEMNISRDCMAKKGVHSLGLCRMGRRELVYLGLLWVLRIL
jgi:hypothetical protein